MKRSLSAISVLVSILLTIVLLNHCKQSTPPPSTKKALDIVLSPSFTYFGHIPLTSTAQRPIVIFNSSDETTKIQEIKITGSDANTFQWKSNNENMPISLSPLEFLQLDIQFKPVNAQKALAYLEIVTTTGTYVDTLNGFGVSSTDGITTFERIIGSPEANSANDVIKTADGGLLMVGSTIPSIADDYSDVYVVKTNGLGEVQWEKNYGGKEADGASCVVATDDGGYLIVGTTESFGAGGEDVYLVKIDDHGVELWYKTLGSAFKDVINQIVLLPSGGFLLVGAIIKSNGQDRDAWVVKIDDSGNEEWSKTFGASAGGETFYGLQEANDNGFYLVGATTSFGMGGFDVYLVKIDAEGNEQWYKTYGGPDWDEGRNIKKLPDGNLIICGYTASKGAGARDIYVLKIDQDGNPIWEKTFGTSNNDGANSLLVDTEGNIFIAGSTVNRITEQRQYVDIYMLNLNSSGQLIWAKTLGGKNNDLISKLIFDDDGGIIGCGTTDSFSKASDVYLIKFPVSGFDF